MATISASYTENQSVSFDDATPAKTVEGKGIIDLDNNGYIAVVIQFKVIFGGSADGDAEIRIRSSSDSGTTKDTELLFSQVIPVTAGATKMITIIVKDVPYIEVGIYNGNGAVEDITISAIYAGLEYSSV